MHKNKRKENIKPHVSEPFVNGSVVTDYGSRRWVKALGVNYLT